METHKHKYFKNYSFDGNFCYSVSKLLVINIYYMLSKIIYFN
jgi:hypothetical protein